MENTLNIYKYRIQRDLSDSDILNPTLSIFTYLVSLQNKNVEHISFSKLKMIVNKQANFNDSSILQAAKYLCGESVPLLDICFEYIDENDDPFPLNVDDAKLAIDTNEFSHPENGYLIKNCVDSIFMFFATSNELRKFE
jgi:hypothetical protein